MVFYHNLDPVLLQLGPIKIYWYGLMYVISFIVVYLYVRSAVRHKKLRISLADLDNLMILLTLALLIGARLFEVFLYNPAYYLANPLQIPMVWKGGLSFHGGLVGVVIVGFLFAKKKKIKFLHLCDIFVVPLALAQAFGRLGNFINGELYGRITNLPWGMKFPDAEGFRHPSQLYELGYNLVIFSFLFLKRNKQQPAGYLLSWFLILYSIFRFLTEFVREPEVMVGPLTLGQVLNIGMLIAGIGLLYWIKKKA
ncbi:prolipoprotein diacylglyceryl transferase [Candidatus Woesearchaeota archaeon]|nr:prolipoprotein diacylglyceryl transferase [Candidatus Woesearchaeota archaeon]